MPAGAGARLQIPLLVMEREQQELGWGWDRAGADGGWARAWSWLGRAECWLQGIHGSAAALLHPCPSAAVAPQAAQTLLLFFSFPPLLILMVIFLGIFSSQICRFCNNFSVVTQMLFWKTSLK